MRAAQLGEESEERCRERRQVHDGDATTMGQSPAGAAWVQSDRHQMHLSCTLTSENPDTHTLHPLHSIFNCQRPSKLCEIAPCSIDAEQGPLEMLLAFFTCARDTSSPFSGPDALYKPPIPSLSLSPLVPVHFRAGARVNKSVK